MVQPENLEHRRIHAVYDESTIRVYQAYSNEIADSALSHRTFVSPPFKIGRMTWIKPSFLWMMYRAGWGFKDEGQRRILAVDITRTGFEWALANSCSSHRPENTSAEEWEQIKSRFPVRIQWDPERDLRLQALSHRSIQIGIGGKAVELYVSQWIQKIADVTSLAHTIHQLVASGRFDAAQAALPQERLYEPLSPSAWRTVK